MSDMLNHHHSFRAKPVVILSACEVGAKMPGDDLAASGIPGALISGGASCVLASLWPVEDISMDYITQRFLAYLSHPGYRPSAALFRAIRDVRRLTKSEVVKQCNTMISHLKKASVAEPKLSEQLLMMRIYRDRIEESKDLHPFLSPQYWGGMIIVGCGWYAPAGALVGGSHYVTNWIENYEKFQVAKRQIEGKKYDEAIGILKKILRYSDGRERVKALDLLAWAIWNNRKKGQEYSARRTAMDLLAQAEFLAKAEQDEQLIRNVYATRKKVELVTMD